MKLPSALEASIVDAVDHAEGYLIASDWLQEHGDPRGELVALRLAERTGETRASARADELHDRLNSLALTDGWSLAWRWGFLRSARRYGYHGADPFAWSQLLRAEEARFIRDIGDGIGPQFHRQLLEHPPLAVRQLETISGELLDRVVAGLPYLEQLSLRHNEHAMPPDAPRLRELAFSLRNPDADAAWLSRSALPRLQRLQLRISSHADARPVLRMLHDLPALEELRLITDGPADLRLLRALPIEHVELVEERPPGARGHRRQFVIDRGRACDHERIAFLTVTGPDPGRLLPAPEKTTVTIGQAPHADVKLAAAPLHVALE